MRERFLASLTVALFVAGSTAGAALAGAYEPYHGQHRVLHPRPAHAGVAVVNAAPETSPTIYPAARKFLGFPYNYHETDGLSRNPNDCAVYGCIDNN